MLSFQLARTASFGRNARNRTKLSGRQRKTLFIESTVNVFPDACGPEGEGVPQSPFDCRNSTIAALKAAG